MLELAGKPEPEILTAVKTVIQRAYAVKTLRSGDIKIIVPDQTVKDKAFI